MGVADRDGANRTRPNASTTGRTGAAIDDSSCPATEFRLERDRVLPGSFSSQTRQTTPFGSTQCAEMAAVRTQGLVSRFEKQGLLAGVGALAAERAFGLREVGRSGIPHGLLPARRSGKPTGQSPQRVQASWKRLFAARPWWAGSVPVRRESGRRGLASNLELWDGLFISSGNYGQPRIGDLTKVRSSLISWVWRPLSGHIGTDMDQLDWLQMRRTPLFGVLPREVSERLVEGPGARVYEKRRVAFSSRARRQSIAILFSTAG